MTSATMTLATPDWKDSRQPRSSQDGEKSSKDVPLFTTPTKTVPGKTHRHLHSVGGRGDDGRMDDQLQQLQLRASKSLHARTRSSPTRASLPFGASKLPLFQPPGIRHATFDWLPEKLVLRRTSVASGLGARTVSPTDSASPRRRQPSATVAYTETPPSNGHVRRKSLIVNPGENDVPPLPPLPVTLELPRFSPPPVPPTASYRRGSSSHSGSNQATPPTTPKSILKRTSNENTPTLSGLPMLRERSLTSDYAVVRRGTPRMVNADGDRGSLEAMQLPPLKLSGLALEGDTLDRLNRISLLDELRMENLLHPEFT